jgi:hypothetical protein
MPRADPKEKSPRSGMMNGFTSFNRVGKRGAIKEGYDLSAVI